MKLFLWIFRALALVLALVWFGFEFAGAPGGTSHHAGAALSMPIAVLSLAGVSILNAITKSGLRLVQWAGVILIFFGLIVYAGAFDQPEGTQSDAAWAVVPVSAAFTFVGWSALRRRPRAGARTFAEETHVADDSFNKRNMLRRSLLMAVVLMYGLTLGPVTAREQANQAVENYSSAHLVTARMTRAGNALPTRLAGFLRLVLSNVLRVGLVLSVGVLFGVGTVFLVFVNGYVLSAVASNALLTKGGIWVALSILPHGVIEIPVLLVCSAYGLGLGSALYRRLRYKQLLLPSVRASFRFFARIAVPCLVLAAAIETFVTPSLALLASR